MTRGTVVAQNLRCRHRVGVSLEMSEWQAVEKSSEVGKSVFYGSEQSQAELTV